MSRSEHAADVHAPLRIVVHDHRRGTNELTTCRRTLIRAATHAGPSPTAPLCPVRGALVRILTRRVLWDTRTRVPPLTWTVPAAGAYETV